VASKLELANLEQTERHFADRRFATAYNAVLQLAKMVIACAGYRVAGRPATI
jgi:hypothetical protein